MRERKWSNLFQSGTYDKNGKKVPDKLPTNEELWKTVNHVRKIKSKGLQAVLTRDIDPAEIKLLTVKTEDMFAHCFNSFKKGKKVRFFTTGQGPIIKATVFLVLPENSISILPLKSDAYCGQCGKKFTKKNPFTNITLKPETEKPVRTCQGCVATGKFQLCYFH
jgi:hypothetical protein